MPTKLSALLVQDRVVSFRQMDAAVQRQQALGGRIGTNLLELGHVDEGILLYYISKQRHMQALDNAAFLDVNPDALDAWDAERAVELMAVPVDVDTRRLTVAVVQPLPDDFVAAFESNSGLELEQALTLEVRMWQALGTLYGVDVPPRYRQLAERFPVPMRTRDGRVSTTGAVPALGTAPPGHQPPYRTPPPTFDAESEAIPGITWSGEELTAFFDSSTNRDQMLLATLGFVGKFFPRRMLYVVTRSGLRGFAVQMPGQPQRPIDRVEIPVADDSTLGRIIAGGSYYYGPVEHSGGAPLYDQLGIPQPPDVCVVPVQVGPRAALLLCADGRDVPIDPQAIPITFLAVNRLARGLERLIRRLKLRKSAEFTAVGHQDEAPAEHRVRDQEAVDPTSAAAADEQKTRILGRMEHSGVQAATAAPVPQKLPDDGWDFALLDGFGTGAQLTVPDIAITPASVPESDLDGAGHEPTAADEPAAPPVEDHAFDADRSPSISGGIPLDEPPQLGDAPDDLDARAALFSPVGGVPTVVADDESADEDSAEAEGPEAEEDIAEAAQAEEDVAEATQAKEAGVEAPADESDDDHDEIDDAFAQVAPPSVDEEFENTSPVATFELERRQDGEPYVEEPTFRVTGSLITTELAEAAAAFDDQATSEYEAGGEDGDEDTPVATAAPSEGQDADVDTVRLGALADADLEGTLPDDEAEEDDGEPTTVFDTEAEQDEDAGADEASDSIEAEGGFEVEAEAADGSDEGYPDEPTTVRDTNDEPADTSEMARLHGVTSPLSTAPGSATMAFSPNDTEEHTDDDAPPAGRGTIAFSPADDEEGSTGTGTMAFSPSDDAAEGDSGAAEVGTMVFSPAAPGELGPTATPGDAMPAVDTLVDARPAEPEIATPTGEAPRPKLDRPIDGGRPRVYGYEKRLTGQISVVGFKRREEESGPQPVVPAGRLKAIDLDVRLPGVLQPPAIREPATPEEEAFSQRIADATDAELITWLLDEDEALSGASFVALLDRGQGAHDALMAAFPGPVLVDRRTPKSVMEPTPLERHGPVIWLVALQLRSIYPRLQPLTSHADADTRYYACRLLQQADESAALDVMSERLFDTDAQIRETALQFLERHLPEEGRAEHPTVVAVRRRLAASESWVVDQAITAIHRLRDSGAVADLLNILDHSSDRTRQKGAQALSRLTLQDFGVNRRKWERWYKRCGLDGRNGWLLDAMIDREWKVRDNAARELRTIPRLVVNYNPDLERRALEAARRAVHRHLYGRDGGGA